MSFTRQVYAIQGFSCRVQRFQSRNFTGISRRSDRQNLPSSHDARLLITLPGLLITLPRLFITLHRCPQSPNSDQSK